MAPSETEIRSLLASPGSYSASNVAQFEAYLAAVTTGAAPYIADANRTLVKLYQLYPETSNETNIGHACLLAMIAHPSTDLLALTYMLPVAQTVDKEPFTTITKCSEQLDACQFVEFWKTFAGLQKSSDAAIAGVANQAVPKLQGSILSILALSYKTAPAAVVSASLNVNKDSNMSAVVTSLKHAAVESVTADSVVFVSSVDNTKRKRVYQAGVDFSAVSSLMAKMGQ